MKQGTENVSEEFKDVVEENKNKNYIIVIILYIIVIILVILLVIGLKNQKKIIDNNINSIETNGSLE